MIPKLIKTILAGVLFMVTCTIFSQEYTSFTRTYPSGDNYRYQTNIKGDLTFISNSILNREGGTPSTEPNDPYNNLNTDNNDWNTETGGRLNYNDYKNMQYIDVDTDPSTFSSSTATFNFPNPDCNRIRYAALYWAATYPSATANGSYTAPGNYTENNIPVGQGRQNDFNQVRFRVPGGAYINITADEILYDGFTSADASVRENSPYACYADVTNLITPLANPAGDYTVANIRATTGGLTPGGGSTGGWTLVIVYENPNLTGKLITTFDGFARVRDTDQVDVNYSGFNTIPAGPVRANVGAATLEGDFRITGDRLRIRAASNGGFTTLSNGANPSTNFFNSNITLNGTVTTNRNPASINTLGYDTDIFLVNNPYNSVIPNNETAATFRFQTNGDQYYPFFNSFNVEIIEPDIVLEKRVEDISGNDITGQGVNLGQILDYVLTFENLGNDDAANYTIRDILPINVTLDESNLQMPTGTSYTFNPATREVVFSIPSNLVRVGQPASSIRMRVQVAENCFDFIDACTDLIENLAFSTYEGVINDNQITDDPSVSDFDTCGFVTPGATNFLLDDLSDCNFTRTVQLCGLDVTLDAGDNFDDYIWVRDDNNNGQIDSSDPVLNDGNPDGDLSTLVVNDIGTYIVDKIVADPCKGFKEIIIVERFGTVQTNPIVDYFNGLNSDADPTNDIQGEIVQCSVDGDLLPNIFLCGSNDSQLFQINITDANLTWERLDESSCLPAPDDCANKNLTCQWNFEASGNNFTATTAGKYRLVVSYQNGCFSRFYFDVYQNELDINHTSRDIICNTDGNITVTNLGSNYGFQLVDVANGTIVVPFSANNGPSFDIATNGAYRVDITQLDSSGNPIPNACIFSTPDIGILDRDFQVDVETTPANCNDQGTIKIDILNVEPNYTYVLRRDDGTLIDDETASTNNTHTFQVNEGDYIIEASTEDGCTYTENVRVDRTPDPTISALTISDIGCTAGVIQLTANNGYPNPDYNYAIWSRNGVNLYPDVASIPGDAYDTDPNFIFGWRDTDADGIDEYFAGEAGTYSFVVVDGNNCFAFSNEVTINDNGTMSIDSVSETQPSCSGDADGEIVVNITGGTAPYQYSIDGGTTYQSTPTFVNLSAGSYAIRVLDSSGCNQSQTHVLSEPFPLSASTGVSRDATCDPNGAEVRVTNVTGGSGTYQYSFDGGVTYGASSVAVLPPGDYTVIVDDGSCEFPMTVTVEDVPDEPEVTLTPEVSYNCDGTGTITATPNIATYNYTYALDGVLNSPDPTSNVFNNVTPGTYTVTTFYTSQTPPTPSILLSEDFGSGETIPSPNTSGYTYEDQTSDPPGDANSNINDFEYSVTSDIVAPFGSWLSPIDHTTGTRASQGRYLVMNVGTPTPSQIIYSKQINDVIPNQDLSVSLYILNLMRQGRSGLDPDLTIEIREAGTTNVIQSIRTGIIPKNTGPSDWVEFTATLNPGANTTLDFVIRSEITGNNGNDFVLDDITVHQVPEVCEQFVETPVTVVAGNVFTASITSATNATCNGDTDATLTIEAENFDAVAGFEYSINGSAFINATTSPVTTSTPLGAGNHTIVVRKSDEITCSRTLTHTISEPTAVVASASITTELTCTNGGATITASVTGGTPGYEYQLEDNLGGTIAGFDFVSNGNNTVFTGLAAGDYIVRVRDVNLCEDAIDASLTISPIEPISYTVTPTACYPGGNTATIQVDVTSGNGDYTFSLNGNPWVAPSPSTATTYTFTGLSNGTYTINVQDGLGCTGTLETITIDPQLTVSASAPNITACATSTDISINATGGDNNYVYAVVLNGTPVVDGDFNNTNPVSVSTAGDYDIHVRDNGGNAGYCSAVHTLTVVQDAPIVFTPTPTDVSCFGGTDGSIAIVVDSGGNAPFMYSIDNGATYVTGDSFPNLAAGTYPVRVRDSNNCESVVQNVTINEPAQIVAEATLTQNYTCTTDGEITVGSITPTSGGSGDYQYSINGGAWTASTTGGHTFTSLTDGTYSIRVRDTNATTCGITLADIIIAPLPVEPTLSTSVVYSCDGTGTITVLPNDPSYTYSLNGATAQPSNIFANVAVGLHTITVNYGSNCTVDTNANIENGHAFEANIVSFENLDCNADGSGTITIDADNYGAGGFEYSVDGNPFVGPFSAAEQITGLAAQAYTIVVRDVDNPIAGCSATLNQTLTEPTPVVTTASITEQFTCDNTGATITASASGGTPAYEYQLEDTLGNPIASYDFATNGNNAVFTGLAVGDYIVRARDTNGCSDPIDGPISVTAPAVPTFTTTETACYAGANDATIQVDVTAGNGNYTFSLDGGPFITPNPSTAVTYTFENLSNGTYTIDVRDGYGCMAVQQTVTIEPQLVVSIDIDEISSCNDGTITVNATGGDGSYVYAFVPANTSPSGLYGASNTFTVTNAMATANPAGFDVYVQDNGGTAPVCSFLQEDIIFTPSTPLTVSGTPTDPECYDGLGSIDVTVGGGNGPFTYQLVDLSPADGIDYGNTNTNVFTSTLTFNGIGVGDYEVIITDEDSCTVTSSTITINNAVEITADINPILPAACNDPDPNEYGFEFDNVVTPTGGTVEYSHDGGTTWQLSNELRGHVSGTEVFPSIRVTLPSGTVCQRDFDRYIIPYPLDNLDISISAIVVNCNDLQVRVQGTAGVAPYEYAYSEDPANFDPLTTTWQPGSATDSSGNAVPAGHGAYTWMGLTPGRTYVFYVRDATGCVRQSLINVNDLITRPIEITEVVTPTCFGGSTGEIEYTLNPGTPSSHMRWEFFEVGNPIAIQTSGGNILYNNTINITGLTEGEYYIEIVQSDGTTDSCTGGSENSYLNELNALNGTPNATRDISCNLPGLITIDNITGGGGAPYTFDVTGPAGFSAMTGVTTNPIEIPVNSPAGNYTVTMYDQYNCSVTMAPINLDLSPNPTIDSVTQDNCAAPISLTAVGNSAAGNLRYAIVAAGNPAPSTYIDNGGVFNNVTPGDYDVYVMDGNGCIATQPSYTVHPVLSADVQLTKLLDCTASPDAVISIEALAGSGSYEYSITNTAGAPAVAQTAFPSNPFDYNAPLAGDYTITIYDTNTPNSAICNREFTISVPARIEPIVDTITTTDVTCNGDSDGTITISTTNTPIGPFTFEITSFDGAAASILPTSTTANTATFTGLAPTTTPAGYIITITAAASNNCTVDSSSITIAEPAPITVTMAPTVEFACVVGNNENNASLTVQNTTGGSNNFVRYEFINDLAPGTPVQDGPDATYVETNFAGGNYTINVYDDNGCVGTTTASITPFDELQSATVTVNQTITCLTGEEITINAFSSITDSSTPAGLANYEFRHLPSGTFQASNVFSNLPTGNHTFEVRNVNTNCIISVSHTVGEPNNFEISVTTTDVVCHGTDGTVSFTISDAINPYAGGFTWQIYNSQGTTTTADDTLIAAANGVSAGVGPTTPFAIGAGEYRVEITQDSNPFCVSSELFNIAGPTDPISANTDVTEVTCLGNDGVIEIIDAQGGWGGYTYFVAPITDPAPTYPGSYLANPGFTGLAGAPGAGIDYQVWVADQNGCEFRLPDVNLVDPAPITADLRINQPNCTNLEGEIEVINVSGGQGSNYSYQLQIFNSGTSTYDNLRSVQTNPIFSGLGAGQYQVIVSDQWNCSATTSASIELYEPIVPLATVVKTIDCSTTDPGGQITITQTGGSGNFDYVVLYPDGVTTDTNTTGIFTGLTQDDTIGEYVFTITDQDVNHACSTTIRQSLAPEVIPVINVDNFTNVTCNGANDGTITVSTTDSGVGPYTFRIIAGNGSTPGSPILPTTSSNTAATFTGLTGSTAGITYTVEVRGANNCAITTDVSITEEDPITVNAISIVQYGCTAGNNTNNATVSFTGATGGTGTYVRYVFIRDGIVVQDGANTIYNETDGLGGSYELRVYDDAGCSAISATDVVIPFVEITDPVVTTTQDAACNPLNNAEIEVGITINPATATPNLEYVVEGINVTYLQTINSSNDTETFTGLEFGNYRVTITNLDTGCVLETVHSVEDPDVIEVVATKLTDEECLNDGVDDGSFSIAINNYTGAYTYQVYDVNDNPVAGYTGTGNTSTALAPFTNLPGGIYYVRVTATDAPRCEDDSNTITILSPSAPITATIREEANVTCSNDEGSIFVDPTGGVGPYTIRLENNTTSQVYTETNVEAFIFTGLSAGDFHVTITDAYSCVLSDNITLIRPDDIVASISATTLSCFNDNTASVTAMVDPRNITPVYQYQLNVYDDAVGSNLLRTSAPQSNATFNGLAAGFYSITVTDDVSCSDETFIVEIVNPTEVTAQLIRTSPLTCTTGVEFELSASGGSGTYEYSDDNATWSPMTGNSVNLPLSGMLSAGTYRYYVRDAVNMCTAVLSNSIEEDMIDPLTLTVDTSAAVINCNGDNTATIYADAEGGLGNYQYELYTDATLNPASRIAGPQPMGEFRNLFAGTYYVNVYSEDCTTPAQRVDITEPTPLEYTDDIINVTCNGEEDGQITVTLSGGAGNYQYSISPNLDRFDDENVFEDLAPGDYTVIAQDGNGCFIELQYTITEPSNIEIEATVLPEVCVGEENGSIELTITGGTAPYSTRLANESTFVQDRTQISGLAAGDYIIFIQDANGCEENLFVTVEPGVNLNAIIEPVYGCNGDTANNYVNILLEDESISDEVLYGLDTTDPAEMQLNPFFRDLSSGTHYIAISHENGCIVTHEFEIDHFEPLALTLSQGNINEIVATVTGGREAYTIYFGDTNNGSDNTYYINRTDTYVVTVVDANGCEVSASIEMEFIDIDIPNFFTPNGDSENQFWKPKNDEGFPQILTIIFDRYGREVYRLGAGDRGWDGTYQQKELPTGDYWYVIKLRGENDDREFVGHFTLYR